jgi:Flp pilus assembly protein TadG
MLTWLRGQEKGQAIIFVAVLAAAIMGVAGMAVEGGRIMVEYRQMQNAADLAALAGAQGAGCTSTSTACINSAVNLACLSAQNNGYGSGTNTSPSPNDCQSTSDTTVHAYIPPQTCSPYNVDYGNGKKPTSCSASSGSYYNYVEVTISRNLGTIPIFGVTVRPFARAVAKKGSDSPKDYALVVLDHGISNALGFSGSAGSKTSGICGVCIIGSVLSNSTASSSISYGGSGTISTCGGQFYTASTSESSIPNSAMSTYSTGSAFFAPPGCTNGAADSPSAWNYAQTQITDPYGSDGVPGASGFSNCATCGSSGHYFHWSGTRPTPTSTTGAWDENGAGTPKSPITKDNWELFPGNYPNGITINGGTVYFNPGLYNVGTGGLQVNGGAVCVFGAPICETFNGGYSGGLIPISGNTSKTCLTASFKSTDTTNYVDPATWYYYCSSFGTWDTAVPYGNNQTLATTLRTEIPYFVTGNSSSGFTNSSTPLNGVTFYSTTGSGAALTTQTGGSIKIPGNGTMSLAFPDPCPGTGTFSSHSVPFQSTMGSGSTGSTAGVYTYPSTSEAYNLTGNSSPAGNLYPSADLTVDGENTCRSLLNNGDSQGRIPDEWPGESPSSGTTSNGQLIQFLFFLRDQGSIISLSGGGTQVWWGIMYNPGNYPDGGCGANTSGSNGCQIKLTGGSGSQNIPMVIGQVIGDGVSLGGSSSMEIFYRPCNPATTTCEQGPGSSLIQ